MGYFIHANEKSCVNENIENIWIKRFPVIRVPLLILDLFRAHLVDPVKNQLAIKNNTILAVTPGDVTSKLQPLDVAINKGFKIKV